ncbi:MAG: SoxR reducing system RseC family protein [Ruminiclostridium sp.]|nr:SoxR reducing system RseC family protein [Ruminiclostridium sp.]
MEQIAVVKAVLANGMAQIAVERDTACGAAHSCHDCAGCEKMMTNTNTVVTAFNDVNAGKGDVVKVRGENKVFFKTAAIVYIVPLILAMAAYFVAMGMGLGEGMQVLVTFVGFALGVLLGVAWDRHMKKTSGLRFRIVEIKKACSGM